MPWTASLIARDGSGAYHYLPRSVSTFLQPGDFARSLQAAGFRRTTATALTMGICVLHRAERPATTVTLPSGNGGDGRTTDGMRQRQDA
jgi:ubiquinone/menaquinone biosynthesis C-methylase UbiE